LVFDFCIVNVTIDQETKFILGAIYIHPNVPQESIETLCFKCLALTLEPLDWYFRAWTLTPRLRFYCAATSTQKSRKISRL
jgi:hypothetical protein